MESGLEPRSEPKDHAFLIHQVMAMTPHFPKQLIIPFHSQRKMAFTHWSEAAEARLLSILLFVPVMESLILYQEK